MLAAVLFMADMLLQKWMLKTAMLLFMLARVLFTAAMLLVMLK